MPETKNEIRSYKVDYKCDECEKGYMRPTGITLASYPEKYPHSCTECDAKQPFDILYPNIVIE